MANLTIRNIPDELHERLKERAKQNRRSLNQEVIAELGARLGESADAGKRQRVWQMIHLAAELRKELGTPLSAEEIRAGIDEGRR
jgi:plasmid stability protein